MRTSFLSARVRFSSVRPRSFFVAVVILMIYLVLPGIPGLAMIYFCR